MLKFLTAALLTLCQTMQAFETYIIDQQSENIAQVFDDVLNLQKTLVADMKAPELPQKFKENGFLTRRFDASHLVELLANPKGKIIAVYQDELMVGYLLLHDPKLFLDWAFGRKFDSTYPLESLENKDILFLDQIGVLTTHAKQGIGRTMINVAKTLAPDGLFTSILHEPFINHASLTFFTKQKFSNLGIMDIDDSADGVFRRIYVMLWSPP